MLRIVVLRLLTLAVLLTAQSALSFSHECETSCSQHCRDQVATWEHVIDAHRDYCDGGNTDCVLNCVRRYSDGTCREYGPDFCSRNPVCVAQCARRYTDGTCREWTTDHCGEAPQNCATQCISRYSDGTCREYGADVCGRNASCRAQCTTRYPDGSCRSWGADVCVNQLDQ